MKDGILIINKPQKWTSHDCVAVCRKASGVKKVGHGGTLDPMAEGLLPIFFGRAAKIMEYLEPDYKTYICTAKLGLITDTLDIWGSVLEERAISGITEDDVRNALGEFTGYIEQIPPKYSAVRINGRRLYEYARKGEVVEARPRRVHIKNLDIRKIDMATGSVSFEVTCSKGTYIRSICDDLGDALGCGAAMQSLCRTESGVFSLNSAVSPDEIKEMEAAQIEKLLLPVDTPLVRFGRAEMKSDRAVFFCNGNSIRWSQISVTETPDTGIAGNKDGRGADFGKMYRVYEAGSGKFLGIGYRDEVKHVLKAHKVLADI